ncbi:ribosomal protein S18-alanine N-acetyltransferase [Amylibacter sp. IMCC11727]|uniref:ribosomal protein S18-alanine N-acetyltransferase n=1 Tax=Amylibacter sp. IMCC11727 TaxID=3039851 RepID=UPI00244DE3FA|nr:ribosomal protein S18-alanine N-acetyltransferase [Amylibacter sp. IMCC11727]WGI20959.1 ribosomal protein S18-alanine N-acetyltransferase [Amylibacter sp. IMCC11727]
MTPAQLAAIHAASFTQPRPWSADEFVALLASERTRLLTSENGFALIQTAGPEAELLTIAVHPNARRTGQGRDLLARALTAAQKAKCEDIFLEVVDDNTPAIALYRDAGFRERAIRKDYYNGANGKKSSALVMHKSL